MVNFFVVKTDITAIIKMMESIILVSEDPTKTSVVWNINFYAMLCGHNMNSLALCAVCLLQISVRTKFHDMIESIGKCQIHIDISSIGLAYGLCLRTYLGMKNYKFRL